MGFIHDKAKAHCPTETPSLALQGGACRDDGYEWRDMLFSPL